MKLHMIGIFSLIFLISGCQLFQPSKTPKSCKSPFVTSGKVTIQGLEIPIGSTKPIYLGNFQYTPQQLQQFTDTAVLFETQRQTICVMLESMLLANATATEIKPIVAMAGKLTQQTSTFIYGIQYTGKTEQVVDEAKKGIDDLDKEIEASTNEPADTTQLNDSLDLITKKLVNLETKIDRSQIKSDAVLTEKFILSGFKKNSIVLDESMSKALRSKLQFTNEPPLNITYDVIGYADGTGDYVANMRLGLERAQSVASAIKQHTELGSIRLVSSGGISQLPGELGRRVEVIRFSTNTQSIASKANSKNIIGEQQI